MRPGEYGASIGSRIKKRAWHRASRHNALLFSAFCPSLSKHVVIAKLPD